MDKRFIKETSKFYQSQRILSFYKKREKSIIIPHLLFYVDRLIKSGKRNQKEIKILDIGCGSGHFLNIIEPILKKRHPLKQFSFYGLDQDKDLISQAKKANPKSTYFVKNLCKSNLKKLKEKFDIITIINTLHEVFSSKLYLSKNTKNEFNNFQINKAKRLIFKVINNFSGFLNESGVLLIFDGLESNGDLDKKIKFRIKNPVLKQYLKKFIKDFSPWRLDIKQIKNKIYEANRRDFTRFITTFKFLNSKLWQIESKESYQFFTKKEFIKAIEKAGLLVESINVVSNDLGLYKTNVDILSKKLSFPNQSILIAGSKKYLFTEFDYFCSDQS